MSLFAKDLLQQLVRTPSVNPQLDSNATSAVGEARLTDLLEQLVGQRWSYLRQTVHPGRDNLVVVCKGNSKVVLWEVHQDTVAVDGMTIGPYEAVESEGRVWGRGACDVKGGMAAMLAALSRLSSDDRASHPTIVLAFCVNEECGFTGARALADFWSDPPKPIASFDVRGTLSIDALRALRPTSAIVAEPTSLDVVVAHKGTVRWRCRTRGRAAHSSRPELGVNAIYAMSDVVRAIRTYACDHLNHRPVHRLCGGPTACVSTIHGGTGVNTVPDEAVIDIDRRLAPDEQIDDAYRELVDFVAAQTDFAEATLEHEPPWLTSFGLADDNNRPWGEQVAAVARKIVGNSELIGVPYGTDAPAIARLGIPTVVFGPGSIDQAHTTDEWIAIDELEAAAEAYYQLAMNGVVDSDQKTSSTK